MIPAAILILTVTRLASGAPTDLDSNAAPDGQIMISQGTVIPALPKQWRIPAAKSVTLDFAQSSLADAWLRHPILGDPSFDSFERSPGNPIIRGSAPFLWPVNVSFLDDPISGNWYAYIGLYMEGYAIGPALPKTHCEVYRSTNKGRTWDKVGPIFDDPAFRFEGDAYPASIAPDVKVVYHDGRYHMTYDWCTDNTTWENASSPKGGADTGCAYAWALHPEGPFHRAPRPILRTSEIQRVNRRSSRYCRVYATSIVRRKRDWLVLVDLDSGSHFAWGQVVLTANDPSGPWSPPLLVTSLEGDRYYPSPVEAFPAFVHGGYVYDPLTSVGLNRNFQTIMRAPIESAHRPDAWQLYQHGSAWHAEWNPNEGFGLWGQTFAGAVDSRGILNVLFPSRHLGDGSGTINAAFRSWSKPFRQSGFTLSAHGARTLTLTRVAYRDFDLHAEFTLKGTAARIAWDYGAPLGAQGRADGGPDPVTWTKHAGLEFTELTWRLMSVGEEGTERIIAGGKLVAGRTRSVHVSRAGENLTLDVGGKRVWSGAFPVGSGPLALLLEPNTNLQVARFAVKGTPRAASQTWLASEAISGAGIAEGSYDRQVGPAWRYAVGAVCRTPHERAKWNFRGRGFRLWSPRGPHYGRVSAILDGVPLGDLDLSSNAERPSELVLTRGDLSDGFHALVLKADEHPMPLDSLEAVQ
ncbi:MAG: hypothetical protein P4L46_11865 [Fimbriimonas sp.]|nr:hypothetical protein [Fimbriimonas sp.]